MGGPAILPLSLAKMAQMTQAFPDREFSGIGGISTFDHALAYFLLGCGTVQVATAAMLDHAIGPNIIRGLTTSMTEFLERHADVGWTRLDDFRGLRRGRIVSQGEIARPVSEEPRDRQHEEAEGYAAPEEAQPTTW
jgi:dihydroorotate dehydrogenase